MTNGVEFMDGDQVKGATENPFPAGSMESGGPVQGPLSAGDKSVDVNVSGEMPSTRGNPVSSPLDM